MKRFKFLFMSLCGAMLFAACNGDSSSSSNGISTSVDQESPSSSVNQAYSFDSGTSEPAGIESSSSCALNEEIESSADVPVSSEDVPLSSSEQSSSSVQESSSSLVDEFVWKNYRGGKLLNTQVVKRFDGNAKEVQIARRVRLVVDHAVDVMNYFSSLETNGVRVIDSVPQDYGVVDVYLTKFEQDIPKTTLAEIIPGFFNSFNVDDTTKIEVNIPSECLENGEIRSDSWMKYSCWPDVSKEDCSNVVDGCGRDLTKENVDCIASQKDILSFYVLCPVTTAD